MSKRGPQFVALPLDAEKTFIAGARDRAPVKGLTHGYYKYPARFSPTFVRAAIEAFSAPGDFCLDPHVGGGTTLVEAMALGRNAVGVDISTLAEFVSSAKTQILSDAELKRIHWWAERLPQVVDLRKPAVALRGYVDLGYYKHLNHPSRWRIKKAIEQAIRSAMDLDDTKLEAFARCAILRTAQWALDGRKTLPSYEKFRNALSSVTFDMIDSARTFRDAVVANAPTTPTVEVINRSAAGMETDVRLQSKGAPKLVITSPPYPGVHVLYHRWQVDGRKEAPLPFMIANRLDGSGGSYYTMGDRHQRDLKTYFDNILQTMSSVAALADEQTIVVQMMAFSEPKWQLPRYLETMEEAGLFELFLPALKRIGDGRLWRAVPGRRWYSNQRGETPGSREVVLIHKKGGRTADKSKQIKASLRVLASEIPTGH